MTLRGIVLTPKWQVQEAVEFDGWDGGQHGHNLVIHLTPEQLGQIPLATQRDTAERLRADVNAACSSIQNEYIANVHLEMDDGTALGESATLGLTLPAFWKAGHLRLFLSHRDSHKHVAHALAQELEEYGISSFVAHDTIEPDAEWLVEINRALNTMEIMLALISDDFHESVWTNQEVGFALGWAATLNVAVALSAARTISAVLRSCSGGRLRTPVSAENSSASRAASLRDLEPQFSA
ncbi:toll/interleukin-1 receptor domain-containing protein [Hyphomicrobium sp. NDB2Meth4]|uniref:toll/interleukin-1 receptor domain-containing protein n=1 Tax=Hyphomicrobium sp. NDB2Meth4 TaxID=1892846 RepID=UPI000930FB93|nr:toll/interleukin-1 receptor domain-containing protein [Hyphomicrobium sp. NDB2Meth4]